MAFSNPRSDVRSSMIIREVAQTERCQLFQPELKDLRESYKGYLGNETYERILSYDSTTQDEDKAAQALLHYDTWTKEKLVKEVPIHRRVQYYTVVQAEKTFATIGIVAALFGIGKYAKGPIAASAKWIKEKTKMDASKAAK